MSDNENEAVCGDVKPTDEHVEDQSGTSSEDSKDTINTSTESSDKSDPGEKSSKDGEESSGDSSIDSVENVEFNVTYAGKKYPVELPVTKTIKDLKIYLKPLIDITPRMMKVMVKGSFKGLAPDDKTLQDLGVTKSSKVLVIGSHFNDIVKNVQLNHSGPARTISSGSPSTSKELCKQLPHSKIIDKGCPDDVEPGIKNIKESLPMHPISGMVNSYGKKVRLTFKLELDQVWIGTQQRTEKINMTSIVSCVCQPISGHEEYSIMGLQLGATEASRYWIYWVPSQYVDAIKSTITYGK